MTLLVLPDAVKVAHDFLLTVTEVAALVGTRVMSRSPESPVYPYVTVQRIGGIPARWQRLDRARLQVDVWGSSEAEASLAARTVRAGLMSMSGYQHSTAFVSDVVDDLGLMWLPDTDRTPPQPRFLFGVQATLHPIP